VRRIRGAVGPLSPPWEPDPIIKIRTHDRVFRTLTWAAALCAVLALLLFAAYFFMLDSAINRVHNLASSITL